MLVNSKTAIGKRIYTVSVTTLVCYFGGSNYPKSSSIMKNFSARISFSLIIMCAFISVGYSQTVTINNQVFKIDTLYPETGNNGLSFPWEITYGPDDSLWVTEAHGYRIWKIHPGDKGSRMVQDLNSLKNFKQIF